MPAEAEERFNERDYAAGTVRLNKREVTEHRAGRARTEIGGGAPASYSRGGSRAVLAGMENDVAARYGAVGNGAASKFVGEQP